MTDLFYSPRLTLVRAQHHIDDFNTTVRSFSDNQPWTSFIDNESKPGKDIHKIKFTQQLPDDLPCILFDVANNLRAVLDQAGYASALAAKSPLLKATKFPFGPTEEKWRNNLAGGCKDLPTEIRAIFEGFNAYKGGNDTLWALNEIANTKKHCALVPLRIARGVARFNAAIPDDAEIGSRVDETGAVRGWDPDKYEMTLLTVPSGLDPHISGHFAFSVAIESIETLAGKQAIGVVEAMRDEVQSVLVATERECRRLFKLSE
jgi:hypothetical protein